MLIVIAVNFTWRICISLFLSIERNKKSLSHNSESYFSTHLSTVFNASSFEIATKTFISWNRIRETPKTVVLICFSYKWLIFFVVRQLSAPCVLHDNRIWSVSHTDEMSLIYHAHLTLFKHFLSPDEDVNFATNIQRLGQINISAQNERSLML